MQILQHHQAADSVESPKGVAKQAAGMTRKKQGQFAQHFRKTPVSSHICSQLSYNYIIGNNFL